MNYFWDGDLPAKHARIARSASSLVASACGYS
jgi:hypothetical protein